MAPFQGSDGLPLLKEKDCSGLPEHLKPMVSFALATGLRRANVAGFKWAQIDLSRRIAWICTTQAKLSKPIGIPLYDEAMSAILSHRVNIKRMCLLITASQSKALPVLHGKKL